ncbi:sigma-E processing peptidase SpoIIGA [Clostridium sp.]|uniref:sigma-E processing peptidase SpoIIGA n=1 Tax=Clostridium sp. TaxID=1506 RepID=UPI0026DAE45C|nr:sigma-E processing peptidase SpoIIGA [Clostridium sp.]MDO5038129.1 sigma-E processing peptidase SpoIIGA [Clostridium sp.]
MNIYIDILLIENFLVNLFLLLTTYKIIREKYSFKMCLLSAILGSLYTLTMVIEEISFLSNNIIQIIVAIVIAYIPLNNKRFIKSLKSGIVFIVSSCVLSGICFKIAIMTNEYSIKNGIMINNFKIKYLILSLSILCITLERITTYIREKNIINNFYYDVEFSVENKNLKIKGFLDSGNELREPITNLPCILVEEVYLNEINLENYGLYHIPYSAIGYDGVLKGFRVDNMKLKKSGQTFKVVDAILCPCKDNLSRENDFNALIPRGVI